MRYCHVHDRTARPLAAAAAAFLSIGKRSLSRLIRARKIEARKNGPRTVVDVASLKAYYASLPKKTDHALIVFGRRAHVLPQAGVVGSSDDTKNLRVTKEVSAGLIRASKIEAQEDGPRPLVDVLRRSVLREPAKKKDHEPMVLGVLARQRAALALAGASIAHSRSALHLIATEKPTLRKVRVGPGTGTDFPDRGIVDASFKTDSAERGMPVHNIDAKTKVMAEAPPTLDQCPDHSVHIRRHLHSLQRRVGYGKWIIEKPPSPRRRRIAQVCRRPSVAPKIGTIYLPLVLEMPHERAYSMLI